MPENYEKEELIENTIEELREKLKEGDEQIEYLSDEAERLEAIIKRISEPIYIVVPFKEGKQQDTELVTRISREAFNEASYLANEYSNEYSNVYVLRSSLIWRTQAAVL